MRRFIDGAFLLDLWAEPVLPKLLRDDVDLPTADVDAATLRIFRSIGRPQCIRCQLVTRCT